MKTVNRRTYQRLRIDQSIKVQVQIFPVMPFIGETLYAQLVNISEGGMSLQLNSLNEKPIKQGQKITLHLRIPGKHPVHCSGKILHVFSLKKGDFLGVKFLKSAGKFGKEIKAMVEDNGACEDRLQQMVPWCDVSCSFHQLCRKPFRVKSLERSSLQSFEIAIQAL
ncbi:MAG: PilZ domain-containing protein [Elusimicrobiota bacterium]